MPSPNKLASVCLLFILLSAFFHLPTAFCDQNPEVPDTYMSGILSIGPNGKIYIQFTKSHAKFTVGKLIMGIPEDVPLDQADQDVFQKAAYLAYNAWLRCEEAKKKAADGKIVKLQMEFECTRYELYSSKEVLIWTTAIQDNNLGEEIPFAEPLSEISKFKIKKDNQKLSELMDLGAVPTAEAYQPPGEQLVVGITPPNIPSDDTSDPVIDTKNLILDTVPIRDTGATSPITP